MLWLGLLGSGIFFMFVLLVFVQKEWASIDVPIAIPKAFWVSSFVILASSFTLRASSTFLSAQSFTRFRIFIALTYFLGLGFLVLQIAGWTSLVHGGIKLNNSTGGAFTFILSGLHLFHVLGGLVALSFLIHEAFSKTTLAESFVFSVNPPKLLKIRLISIYWHFLDVLWWLIFLFLLYHASQNQSLGT